MYGDYPNLGGVRRILVVKLRHLGDVLLTTPLFTALKKKCPSALIDAYIYKEAAPILEGHPAIDRLWLYDRNWKQLSFIKRIGKEISLLSAIRGARYDLVVQLTEGDRGAFLSLASGAPIRVGMAPKNQILKKSFTHLAKQSSSLRHTVERNLDVIRRIGIFPSIEERELFFEVPVSSKEVVHKMVGHEPFVLIHPTSRWQFKCLPIERMKELVQNLLDQGKRVVLSSGPDAQEKKMVDAIGSGFPVLNLGGALSLQELGALIDASELLICVDSLAFHMANALKKRVIVFFGPTSEITWGPWRNPHARVVTSSMSCRPCYQDGCGGSKVSDCLANLSIDKYGLARISHTSG